MRQLDSARPISGEIMMPGATLERPQPVRRARDTVDAEYETVLIGGSHSHDRDSAPAAKPTDVGVAGLDMLRPGAGVSRNSGGRGGPLFWLFGAVLIAGAFWIAGGHSLVHDLALLPASAPAQALRLVDVQSRVERHGGKSLLFVDGAALNEGDRTVSVPGLSIDVLARDGSTTRYFLGTNDQQLEPGTRFPFSSRLVAPSEGVKSVSVTFRPS